MRKELGIDVEKVRGSYGEYKVLVDGDLVIDGGPMVMLGVMPSSRTIIGAVRDRLASANGASGPGPR